MNERQGLLFQVSDSARISPPGRCPLNYHLFPSEGRDTVDFVGRRHVGSPPPTRQEVGPGRGTESLATCPWHCGHLSACVHGPLASDRTVVSVTRLIWSPRHCPVVPGSSFTRLLWFGCTVNRSPPSLQRSSFKTSTTLNVKLLFKFQGF